ncbi:ATP-binding protein [uncultured Aquabacterium sp.]|uniref:ATP-binding protein n=1 Tax=uncultured Aquabacterium sp. TaxID=158753 RepID=UPI0025E16A61|nr:ATP-binding protein [uncultured Aquabacterium sp.]
MQFTKAVRKKAKLRLALTGPSGSGKTYGALMIAQGLGGKIAVIDTEHGSASLYSDLCEFDTLELTAPYSPERYIEAIKAAERAGYDTLIIDSTTHEWSGSGGCLEINEQTAQAKFRGNTWSAWNETTPRHRRFIDAMLQSKMHIIATGRSKTETSQEDAGNGKKKVVKLGMKTEQRDGFEYEFTVVLDLVHDGHYALASKDRTNLFGSTPFRISDQTGKDLSAWLESGADMQPVAPWYEELLLTLEGCESTDELKAAWEAAKKAAQERGDRPAYDAMKNAMEAAAAAIKEASDAQTSA